MPTEIVNLLIQLPIVAVFIWYSERMNKQFQDFLKEQREADRKTIESLVQQVLRNNELLEVHDRKTDMAISTMKERTRPRPTPRSGRTNE